MAQPPGPVNVDRPNYTPDQQRVIRQLAELHQQHLHPEPTPEEFQLQHYTRPNWTLLGLIPLPFQRPAGVEVARRPDGAELMPGTVLRLSEGLCFDPAREMVRRATVYLDARAQRLFGDGERNDPCTLVLCEWIRWAIKLSAFERANIELISTQCKARASYAKELAASPLLRERPFASVGNEGNLSDVFADFVVHLEGGVGKILQGEKVTASLHLLQQLDRTCGSVIRALADVLSTVFRRKKIRGNGFYEGVLCNPMPADLKIDTQSGTCSVLHQAVRACHYYESCAEGMFLRLEAAGAGAGAAAAAAAAAAGGGAGTESVSATAEEFFLECREETLEVWARRFCAWVREKAAEDIDDFFLQPEQQRVFLAWGKLFQQLIIAAHQKSILSSGAKIAAAGGDLVVLGILGVQVQVLAGNVIDLGNSILEFLTVLSSGVSDRVRVAQARFLGDAWFELQGVRRADIGILQSQTDKMVAIARDFSNRASGFDWAQEVEKLRLEHQKFMGRLVALLRNKQLRGIVLGPQETAILEYCRKARITPPNPLQLETTPHVAEMTEEEADELAARGGGRRGFTIIPRVQVRRRSAAVSFGSAEEAQRFAAASDDPATSLLPDGSIELDDTRIKKLKKMFLELARDRLFDLRRRFQSEIPSEIDGPEGKVALSVVGNLLKFRKRFEKILQSRNLLDWFRRLWTSTPTNVSETDFLVIAVAANEHLGGRLFGLPRFMTPDQAYSFDPITLKDFFGLIKELFKDEKVQRGFRRDEMYRSMEDIFSIYLDAETLGFPEEVGELQEERRKLLEKAKELQEILDRVRPEEPTQGRERQRTADEGGAAAAAHTAEQARQRGGGGGGGAGAGAPAGPTRPAGGAAGAAAAAAAGAGRAPAPAQARAPGRDGTFSPAVAGAGRKTAGPDALRLGKR